MHEIKAKLLKTKNIKKTLQMYAENNLVALNDCDFDIKAVMTYIKTVSLPDFVLVNDNINEEYAEKERLLNEHVELHQVYIIEAKLKTSCMIQLNYSIDFGKYSTHPKLILSADSKIAYKTHKPQEIFSLLIKEINKIKAQNGILINIFDTNMKNTLKKFVPYLYAGKFVKKIKIPLYEGLEPELSQESQLLLHFQNKPSTNELIEVEEDELLVEFLKPLYGKKGFNSFGAIIDSSSGINHPDLDATIDNASILIEEDEERKLYKSKLKGFVTLQDKKLLVENKIRVSKLSRLNTSIAKEEKNNIEVHVAQNDTNKDSIGAGVELKSETIHITGHVGANSILEALSLQIDGATHKDSSQFANNAKINRHKGVLRCNNAKINLLEGGEVHATTVEIDSSLGGSIYAQDVTIGTVKHHLKVYASNSITIKRVLGEDNVFKINYKEIPILNSKLHFLEEEITIAKESLKDAKKHNLSKVPLLEEKLLELSFETNKIKESSKSAKISVEEPFRGLNTIVYILDNGDELVYKTNAQAYTPFYLEISEDRITLQPVNKSIPIKS